jgi:hypothetical protein
MPKKNIKWAKKYYEDLGTQNEEGLYDYAYRYFIYEFFLPDNDTIAFRQYTDTSNDYSMCISLDGLMEKSDDASKEKVDSILAIISFMRLQFGIENFYFLRREGYKVIDLEKLKNKQADFSFKEEWINR